MRRITVCSFLMPVLAAFLVIWPRETVLALEETEFRDVWIREETELDEIMEDETERQTKSEREEIKTEAAAKSEAETAHETEMAAIYAVPEKAVPDECFIRVSWTDKASGLCLVQGEDDEKIRAIREGVWELEFVISSSAGDVPAESGGVLLNCSCTYPLVLPLAQARFSRFEGQDPAGFLSWTLEQSTGILTITKDLPSEFSRDFVFRQTVTFVKEGGKMEAEAPLEAQISMSGLFDPVHLKLDWEVKAAIPSSDGSFHGWAVCFKDDYNEDQFGALGDLRVASVNLNSAGYQGAVPQLEEAGEEDLFAWQFESSEYIGHSSVSKRVLVLLSRCGCSAENGCQCWEEKTKSCVKKVPGSDFCKCWQHPYNAELDIHFCADACAMLQNIEGKANDKIRATIQNYAELEEDGEWAGEDTYKLDLKKILTKNESAAPSAENDAVGSYKITVNPNHFAYDGTDSIIVTDRLQNLAHLSTGQISAVLENGGPLTLIDEAEALAMKRTADTENRFYSVRVENCMEESKIGEILTIQLWFPTNLSCVISYDAMIIDPDKTDKSGKVKYGNTAEIGGIETGLSGSLPAYPAPDLLNRRRLILSKHDAENEDIPLEGAEFEVFFYQAELYGRKEDVRLDTLVTDEKGEAFFCSAANAEAGAYVIQPDQLYYLRELRAPEGYEPDEKLYWFYWEKEGIDPENLPEGENLLIESSGPGGTGEILLRIPNRKREIPDAPELPETGGPGNRSWPALALILAAVSAFSLSLLQLRDLFCRWYTYKLKQRVRSRQNG